MSESQRHVKDAQTAWSRHARLDSTRRNYATSLIDNLFLTVVQPETETDFRAGDGAELDDSDTRPAKMRSLVSSSALAVNFFDAWRHADLSGLGGALGLANPIGALRFEHKTANYPVGPRSPNLDLLLTLQDGSRVAIESKFTEPFRTPTAEAALSPKYFPDPTRLWEQAGLKRAQLLAESVQQGWDFLDAAQLLKHLLGLAHDSAAATTLLYLWYDTGLEDAAEHRREVERFSGLVSGGSVAFASRTYQEVFGAIGAQHEPATGWHNYMKARYFNSPQNSGP